MKQKHESSKNGIKSHNPVHPFPTIKCWVMVVVSPLCRQVRDQRLPGNGLTTKRHLWRPSRLYLPTTSLGSAYPRRRPDQNPRTFAVFVGIWLPGSVQVEFLHRHTMQMWQLQRDHIFFLWSSQI